MFTLLGDMIKCELLGISEKRHGYSPDGAIKPILSAEKLDPWVEGLLYIYV